MSSACGDRLTVSLIIFSTEYVLYAWVHNNIMVIVTRYNKYNISFIRIRASHVAQRRVAAGHVDGGVA